MELWTSRQTELIQNKSKDWNIAKLRRALRSLKSNKTIDPNNMINEIFKEGCIGKDLEKALLILFNQVKTNLHLPNFLIKQNITSIFKNKGSRLILKNDRGIFILTSLRKILDKLLYFDKYAEIDKNMTDSQIGARYGRQVKDHLFVVYGIINLSLIHI